MKNIVDNEGKIGEVKRKLKKERTKSIASTKQSRPKTRQQR